MLDQGICRVLGGEFGLIVMGEIEVVNRKHSCGEAMCSETLCKLKDLGRRRYGKRLRGDMCAHRDVFGIAHVVKMDK